MYIKQLTIKRFRGIGELRWNPGNGVNCLIGPGDSCKTTVLDALDLLFAERHNATFDDLDFYKGDTSSPIQIFAVLANLPREFLRDDRYGLHLSGWRDGDGNKPWADEPDEAAGIKPVLVVALEVDSKLEPNWHVFTRRDGNTDKTKKLVFEDRKVLSPARLGVYSNRHLSWGRGSALQRIGPSPEELPTTLSQLVRAARKSFTEEGSTSFKDPLEAIGTEIERLGVRFESGVTANLDFGSISMGAGGVALHDGEIPVRCMGTGSSRLAVAALQSANSASRQFFLVDELEYGLEPHRASLLISHLRTKVKEDGQVFMTTHSPVVLRELRLGEVFICRKADSGTVKIRRASIENQESNDERRYIRSLGEAFLAKKILVCEGQTEVGLMKGWSSSLPVDFQSQGIAFVDGGGDPSSFGVATHFARLGYQVAILTDSDKAVEAKVVQELATLKIAHFSWGNARCTEVELFLGVATEQREELLKLVLSEYGYPAVSACGQVSGALKTKYASVSDLLPLLKGDTPAETIGLQAHQHKWIKTHYDLCFLVGEKIFPKVMESGIGTCAATLGKVQAWLNDDA